MKKLFVVLLFIISLSLNGQTNHGSNTLYASAYLINSINGGGIKYDRQFTEFLGVYTSLSHANIKLFFGDHINDIWKASMGIIKYMKYDSNSRSVTYFEAGAVYNKYNSIEIYDKSLYRPLMLVPYSFELGFGVRFISGLSVNVDYNIIKNSSNVGVGYNFKFNKH